MHHLKSASYVLLGNLAEDHSLGDSLSALRNCSKEVREEVGYIGVFAGKNKNKSETKQTNKNPCSQTPKDYC